MNTHASTSPEATARFVIARDGAKMWRVYDNEWKRFAEPWEEASAKPAARERAKALNAHVPKNDEGTAVARVLEAARAWAVFQDPDSQADQRTDAALRSQATLAVERLLGAVENLEAAASHRAARPRADRTYEDETEGCGGDAILDRNVP